MRNHRAKGTPGGIPSGAGASSWITQGSLIKAVWRLSLPMMAAAVLQDVFAIVDMIFVGRLGPAAVAAVAVSGTILGIIYMLGVGVTTGCTALVAQAVGGGNRSRAQQVVGQSLVMMAGISMAVAALGIPWAEFCLRALGAEPEVVAAGRPYLQISAGGAFAMLLAVTFASALRGAGDAITPLKIMGVANVMNIILDPILIFGLLGMPALGVAGSAVATLTCRFFAASWLAIIFFWKGHIHFRLYWQDLSPRFSIISQMFRIGIFGSGQVLIRNISALILVRLVAMFGTVALASYGIGMRLRMVVMMVGMGFANAAAALVGQNIGALRMDRAARAGWLTAAMYSLIAVPLTIVFFVLAEHIVAIFNSQPEVVTTGANFVRWFSATFVFLCLSMVLGRSMNGAGDTFWPMVITGVSMIALRIPAAYGFAHLLKSVTGVWVGLALSNVVQGLLFAAAFRWGHWKAVGRAHVEAAQAHDVARAQAVVNDPQR
ncbi:MAG: hypothetical protein AMS15_04690 [Planctomycetes bacterium DG_23]|nr:MAG: hypothetical protein AMS15_04690 [Planctomycetes bacterium DG_23]